MSRLQEILYTCRFGLKMYTTTPILKYLPKLFIKNIEYLVKYGGEPEIETIMKDGKKISIIAYEDFIDFYDENDNYQKLDNIKQAVEKIDFANILDIIEDSGMDLSRPIEEQSMLVDGELWLTPSR